MKKRIITVFFLALSALIYAQDAKELVAESIEAIGGKKKFYSLKNVNYDLEYRAPKGALTLLAHETYVFHKELSYATYTEHTLLGKGGTVIEGYDGTDAWVTLDGKLSNDEQANGVARFLRKTNYYWFAMFFKLLDKGINYELTGSKSVNGQDYHLVKITFGNKVGDAQDTYVLYINKKTKLIDQFLFTVIAFGVTNPNLMTFEYKTIDGIKIPSKRKYIESNWNGDIIGKEYTITNWTNIKFNTDIDKSIFEKPVE